MRECLDQDDAQLARMEGVVARVLQGGVLVSAVLVIVGVAWWAVTGRTGYAYGVYPMTVHRAVRDALAGRPLAVVQCGLLALILTPVIRVAASVVVFARQRDRIFTIITLVVLALLLTGIFAGHAE
jgi:uncharacterized membrane protein